MSKKHEPGMAYDMDKLHKIFAVISVIFLITVIWVFLDDYLRPWKGYQIQAMKIEKQRVEAKIKIAEGKIDPKKLEEVNNAIAAGEKQAEERSEKIEKLEDELAEVKKELQRLTITSGIYNSKVAATGFNQGVAWQHHDDKKNDKLLKKLGEYKEVFGKARDEMKAFTVKEKALTKAIANEKREFLAAKKELKNMTRSKDLLLLAKQKQTMDPLFFIRNAPFLDYLHPTVKINQIVVNNITDDRYFRHVPKVDRCTTCHVNIDKPGYEKEEQPFSSHPKLGLMIGAESPHPMKNIGCTVCHGGEGHRVNDMSSVAHIPQNKEQELEWIKKYNWHAPHRIPSPMLPAQYTEGACIKCHQGVAYIPGADKLNAGNRKIEEFGCYACHKIEGWEHKRKPGPSLEKIASKVSKEFFKNWVWDPKGFNKHAKMPAFFNQTNNSRPDFMKKNIAEVNAMTEYVWEKSKAYKPFMKAKRGDAKKGKELIGSVGCLACHGVEGFEQESKKINAYAGPYLTGTGSKVKSADWMVSWLKKPSHYQEDTIMPSFRLSDKEANDITAYLMGLRNKSFEVLEFEKMDKKARDEILLEYFSAFDTAEVAKARLEKMTDKARTMELGKRSVGKYGCYSCHSIEGFDGRAPIGPELSKIGAKPLTQFGFNNHHHTVHHSRHGWIKAHMINPRMWDDGLDKPFKDLNRMPNFNMSEKEAEMITLSLLGLTGEYIPLAGVKRMSAHEKLAAEGMKVVDKYNCMGCHEIDGHRGDILNWYKEDDINNGPPLLVDQGHRVQADWFYHFLDNVYPIRPWLEVRMPSFNLTKKEKNAIVSMFQSKSEQQTFEANDKKVVWKPGEKAAAKKLFHETLACTSCHTAGFNNDEATAPNLYYAKRRLRPSWIKKWLENPQSMMPDTVMPNFWEDGESQDEETLGGDKDAQIEALTKYILELGHDEYTPHQRGKKF